MKGRVIVIDTPAARPSAAALVVNGRLEDLILDPPTDAGLPMVGDVITARLTRKLPGKGGAFCDLGDGTHGFLRDAGGLGEGASALVQVTSLPEPGKAVGVSPRILFKGPNLILTPGATGVNVSRAIKDPDERARLEAGAATALSAAGIEGTGIIVRTGAEGVEGDVLQGELERLGAVHAAASAAVRDRVAWSGRDGAARMVALREWVHPLPDQVLVPSALAEAAANPWGDARLSERICAVPDPFEAAGIWDQVEALRSPEVAVAGGSMVIEATRALVAVDVNTGGDFSPAAGLKANIAAIRDLPRQLRLRGLGGQIVVDFAPMPKRERKGFDATVKAAFRRDPIETSLVGWTTMGLYELQRKRERWPLNEVLK